MKVLIACEESQTVCKAFREKGHEAYSCDIIKCSGGHPEWHIQDGVLPIIGGGTKFKTMDGETHEVEGLWDLVIAHPPCTYLTVTGNRWFNGDKYLTKAENRYRDRLDAINFFMEFVWCKAKRVAIENPIGIMSSVYRKPDQIIQPYEFGEPAKKATCLWLKNLQPLVPTKVVEPELVSYKCKNGKIATFGANYVRGLGSDRAAARSKTFSGIAKAMAEQWG